MTAKTCTKCGVVNASGARFCTHCGAPLAKARPAEPEQWQEEDAGPRGLLAAGLWFLDLLPGLLSPKVLIMSILAFAASAGVGWLGLNMVAFGAFFAGFAIAGFAVVIYWTAWAWLIYGYVCLPAEALADFDGKRWTMMFLTTAVPVAAFFIRLSR